LKASVSGADKWWWEKGDEPRNFLINYCIRGFGIISDDILGLISFTSLVLPAWTRPLNLGGLNPGSSQYILTNLDEDKPILSYGNHKLLIIKVLHNFG